jgi:DNA polymerase elongation subunit (family B)
MECKLIDFVVSDKEQFTIQMFGIDEQRVTYSILVYDFHPFVYLRVGDDWSKTKGDRFMDHLKSYDTTKMAYRYVYHYEMVEQKTLYGFDGGKLHKFMYISCHNMKFIHALKKMYYSHESEKVMPYSFEGTATSIYECMIPPLLRFFHIQEISPSGWIEVKKFKLRKGNSRCVMDVVCSYKDIVALKKDTAVPYKICSFDIEASSSHGDFPEAIKDYKKVAYDMVYQLDKANKEEYSFLLKELLLNVFSIKKTLTIDICYPKSKVTEKMVLDNLKEMLQTTIQEKPSLDEKIQKYFKKEKEEEEETPETIQKHSLKESDLITFLASDTELAVKIVYFMDLLGRYFPELEGDQVTFIGSTFIQYGQEEPYLQHCVCVNQCTQINPDHVLECYPDEQSALVAWSALIRKEDPDIIIGYNIFGFDYKFMFERASELDCLDEFMDLGRNETYSKELEVSKIVLASGPYDLSLLIMEGRLQIDLYTHMRKEFNLTSYKLDYVAGYLLGDTLKRYENQGDCCRIWSQNLKGISVGSFIHFEIINHSGDLYEDGKKFKIVQMEPDGFVIEGQIHCEEKMSWGMAKDDVSPKEIFEMTKGTDDDRGVIAKYCIQDCNLVHHIFQKIDVLTTFIEMSKLCSVPINFLVMRGQGIKGTSYIAKKCRENQILMPLISKGSPYDLYEGAIVLEPKCNLYLEDPVACVDYGSLYPSSIISENLSHDSKVWTKEYNLAGEMIRSTGVKDDKGHYIYDNLSEYTYVDVKYDTFAYRKNDKILTGYKVCRFAQYPDDKKAILPSILQELLAARKATKKQMEKEKDPFQKNILDKRQLSIKITANSLYGQCGAKTSTFYEMDVAASTTAVGRKLLIYGKDVIETVYKYATVETRYGPMQTNAEYVYGDTDSVFFTFHLTQDGKKLDSQKALEVTIDLAQEAGALATMFLKKPHDLEYEKTFLPFCLLSKKRYVGMLYETDPTKCKCKSMGIVLKRRDNAPIVKDVYGGIIDILMKDKNIDKSIEFLHKQLTQISERKVPVEKLIISKSLRSFYKNPKQIAHNVLAERIGIRDPGNKPAPGDRIPYIYILNALSKLQGDKIEIPDYIKDHKLKIDYGFYISNQIMKPVLQIYSLILYDMKEFRRRKPAFMLELDTLRSTMEYDKFEAKEQKMKLKEVEKILFEKYLREDKNVKAGNRPITGYFTKA